VGTKYGLSTPSQDWLDHVRLFVAAYRGGVRLVPFLPRVGDDSPLCRRMRGADSTPEQNLEENAIREERRPKRKNARISSSISWLDSRCKQGLQGAMAADGGDEANKALIPKEANWQQSCGIGSECALRRGFVVPRGVYDL